MIHPDRLLETFLAILRVDSYYPNEDRVIEVLRPKLRRLGVQLTADAHRNLLGFWPGSDGRSAAEPILLCAHTDTVRSTEGMQPIVRDGAVHSDGTSVLGADDKAAVAAIVEALEAVAEAGVTHPPVEILFTVGEDVGHIGSKAFDVAPVLSRMAFVPDVDGPVGRIVMAAPWIQNVRVTFHGRAAHAGMEPENGRSALVMAARAVADMRLGRIDAETTSNVGKLKSGDAPNIVPARAEMVIQVRSLDRDKCRRLIDEMTDCCNRAAAQGDGRAEVDTIIRVAGYRFQPTDLVVQRAESAIRAAGLDPQRTVTCGGSDANELNAKGLPTVVISVGYRDIHTNQESMPIDQLNRLAEVCATLMLGN